MSTYQKEDFDDEDFIPFKDQKEFDWSDVTPVKQYQGEITVMHFKYPPDCKKHQFL